MKFSYSLLKKLAPKLPSKEALAEALSHKAFEVEEISGDTMEIKLTANRWSDASSHLGMARDAAAIFGLVSPQVPVEASIKTKAKFPVMIEKNAGCRRYIGTELSLKKSGKTPEWMKKFLEASGQRSINCVVDIMNYVMIEIGQPLHAFDADRVSGGIVIRRAKRGETLLAIDEKQLSLSEADLVIADRHEALALAGVKGGKMSEVTGKTKRIILEAANFDNNLIYRTARRISLQTDASQRFGRNLSPELAEFGAKRAIDLLRSLCGAEVISANDVYPEKQKTRIVAFDAGRFKRLTGLAIPETKAGDILKRLGFKRKKAGLYEVPYWRMDVSIFEDLAEEVIRIHGFSDVRSEAPTITLVPLHDDPTVAEVRRARYEMAVLGYSEVYNYSFGPEGVVELMNPIAEDKRYLRPDLIAGLMKNIDSNRKHSTEVRLFEIGKVFHGVDDEELLLGAAIYRKGDKLAFAELKGAFLAFAKNFGNLEINFEEENDKLVITRSGEIIGRMTVVEKGAAAALEVSFKALTGAAPEKKFEPIPEYPAITRDISFWVYGKTGVGRILSAISEVKPLYLVDLELVDLYNEENRRGITYRLVFRSPERTLSDLEADRETEKAVKKVLELPEVEAR